MDYPSVERDFTCCGVNCNANGVKYLGKNLLPACPTYTKLAGKPYLRNSKLQPNKAK